MDSANHALKNQPIYPPGILIMSDDCWDGDHSTCERFNTQRCDCNCHKAKPVSPFIKEPPQDGCRVRPVD